jgi:two-component system cell cycle sensor histidine kinase PleC
MIAGVLHGLDRRIAESGVTVETVIAPDLPLLVSDEARLRQILANLVSNAAKFTAAGGHVTVRAYASGRGAIGFEIADTGIGIAEADIPIALAAFGQIDSALNRRYQGAGLGLTLAKELTGLLGGRLEISSRVGQGTTIRIILPAAAEALPHAAE